MANVYLMCKCSECGKPTRADDCVKVRGASNVELASRMIADGLRIEQVKWHFCCVCGNKLPCKCTRQCNTKIPCKR